METLIEHVLEGWARKGPLGQIMITRRPGSRVLKDIHTNNLLPWYCATFPEVPVVFAVRHPIASARSRQRYGDFYGLGRYFETAAGARQPHHQDERSWRGLYF